ncbi:DMT family transporter [Halodesulfovibrio sp.]|uniref:DMT family transporter n=1 Tax=Halodesulfovibrio sp. TaxID=1912772 RepID=UPI0025E3B1CE|nr:DMT family transporter [Halodesulfovibrio sp.]MCT4535375.1 DMT family transporter [Halodesulfovibrio sp.]MCT4626188.1 DMT family transporter [Halodesulfovibrio sp.]
MRQQVKAFFSTPYIAVPIGALIISFSPVLVRLTSVSPDNSAFYRVLFGGITLMLLSAASRERISVPLKIWGLVTLTAVFFAIDLQCWHRAIVYVGPGLATILGNLQVFVTAAFGALLFKEIISKRLIAALPLAVFGLFLLIGLDLNEVSSDILWGLFFGILTAVSYSCYIITLRQSQSTPKKLPLFANMGIISLLTAACIGVAMQAKGGSFVIPTVHDWGYLVAYGVFCQGIGWAFISKGLPELPAAIAGLLMLLQPALAFVWDVLFFNRPTGAYGLLGVALVLFAIGMGIYGQQAVAANKRD